MTNPFSRKQVVRALLGAAVGLVLGGATALAFQQRVPLLMRWESATVDGRFRKFAHPDRVSPNLVVVLIDDATERGFHRNGLRFPPTRDWLGTLLESLYFAHPKAIVFDYLFDNDVNTAVAGTDEEFALAPGVAPATMENEYAQQTFQLAMTMWNAGNAAFGLRTTDIDIRQSNAADIERYTQFDPALLPRLRERTPAVHWKGIAAPEIAAETPGFAAHLVFPNPDILAGARAVGFVDTRVMKDADDVVRHFEPVTRVDGIDLPALAVTGALIGNSGLGTAGEWVPGQPPPPSGRPALPACKVENGRARFGALSIPVDERGRSWIVWRGDWEREPALVAHTQSAWRYIQKHDDIQLGTATPSLGFDPAKIAGSIVLVGFTAHGEYTDKVASPFGETPGIFAHASVLDTLLSRKDHLQSPPAAIDGALILLLSVLVGVLTLGLPQFRFVKRRGTLAVTIWLVGVGIVPIVLYAAGAMAAFPHGYVVNIVPAVASAVGVLVLDVGASVAFARRETDKATALASRALSPQLVARYQKEHDGVPTLGGEKVELTVYFSDIQGFTTLSESLSPEALVAILNEYLTRVTELIEEKHGAYLDKYIGDAVMAFWGAPEPQPDGPVRACLAAIDAMEAMEAYSTELVQRGLPMLKTRIGINTGPAVAGGVGHPRGKFNYTVLGDTVNLASRLEGANKAYGTRCMIGEATFEATRELVLARELDLVKVKGKHIAVRVYELLGRASDPLPREREIKRRYEAALARYRARGFAAAKDEFDALVREHDDPPSKTLSAACARMISAPPPPDWDGSNELHEK